METPDPITDEWIRNKLKISTDNLEDIKVLSLPGSYQEKIIHLGDALYKFSRIKELDLSRNSIVSLEGLENLKYLEKLNLYFNNISTLKEIDRLSKNKNLIELDLRLNPITKEEADYRLYLINILPSLEVCDDREIKDGERQMALTYYKHKNLNKKQDYELYSNNNDQVSSKSAARIKSISNIVKRAAGINEPIDNHEIVQNFLTCRVTDNDQEINRNKLNSQPAFEQYSPKSLKEIGERESREHQRRNSTSNSNKRRSVSLHDAPNTREDKILQFSDEPEAYSAYKSRAAFTPNPQYEPEIDDYEIKNNNNNNKKIYETEDNEVDMILSDQKNNPIFNLLDLVDRYWNGTKSLHKNFKFLGLANQLLTQYAKYTNDNNPFEIQVNLLQSQLKNSQDENRKLQQYVKQIKQNKENEIHDIEVYNKNYQSEIDSLKKKLIITQEENKRLRKELTDRVDKAVQDHSLESMESENDNLKKDVEVMKLKLKQYEQLQQLTEMLQESHKSLVTTNEHLLREISDQKPIQTRLKNENSFEIDDADFFDIEQKFSNQQTSTLNNRQRSPVVTRKQQSDQNLYNQNRYVYS